MQEQGTSGKDQPLCLDCARHPPDSFGHEPRNFAAATPQTDKDATASGDRATTFASIIHKKARQRAINSKKHFARISTSSRHNCQQNTTPTSSRSFPFLSLFELSLTQQQQSSPNTNNPHSLNTYVPSQCVLPPSSPSRRHSPPLLPSTRASTTVQPSQMASPSDTKLISNPSSRPPKTSSVPLPSPVPDCTP